MLRTDIGTNKEIQIFFDWSLKKNYIQKHEKIALLIGNQDYENKWINNCENAIKAVVELEKKLKKLNFEVVVRTNLAKVAMVSCIREFREKIKDHDIILFFYDGWGMEYNNSSYLMPTSCHKIITEKEIEPFTISLSMIVTQLTKIRNSTCFFITDCGRRTINGYDVNYDICSNIPNIKSRGVVILYACGFHNSLPMGKSLPFLVMGILKYIDEDVDIERFCKLVTKYVVEESNGRQHPHMESNNISYKSLSK